jgi:hypothetical protein
MLLGRRVSRRRFIGVGATLAAAAATLGFTCEPQVPSPAIPLRGRATGPRHLAWVWQFSNDGGPERVVSVLAQYNLGILLKTHDGTDWMSTYDASPYAVYGSDQVGMLANYFEKYGVPFHAWCVAKGLEPVREAEMAAQVIAAGARSLTVDVEPHSGFWQGTPQDAVTFGQELRKLQPGATVFLSIDPRPWVLSRVPLAEFATFGQGFAPQIYWETFNSSDNVLRFEASGFPPGAAGITPEFLLDVSRRLLRGYNFPIQPVGQGASRNATAWQGFLKASLDAGLPTISVWRYGVTSPDVWRLLSGSPAPTAVLTRGGNAIVTNTGTCLNVRESASVNARILACLSDGTMVHIADGPVEMEGYRWWLIEAGAMRGWSAEAPSTTSGSIAASSAAGPGTTRTSCVC